MQATRRSSGSAATSRAGAAAARSSSSATAQLSAGRRDRARPRPRAPAAAPAPDEAETYLRLDEPAEPAGRARGRGGRPDLWADTEPAARSPPDYGQAKADVDVMDGLGPARATPKPVRAGRRGGRGPSRPSWRRRSRPRHASSTSSSCGRCSPASTTSTTPSCEIHAGDGGTDAQDWAEMMLRMYQRWAERRASTSRSRRSPPARRPGSSRRPSSSAAATPTGLLASERGVHRLVRISPVRLPGPAADELRLVERDSVARGPHGARSTSTRRTCASTPTAPRAPAASTSTSPTPPCASPTCRPASSSPARTNAASTRTRPRPCRSSAAKLAERQREERRADSTPWPDPKPSRLGGRDPLLRAGALPAGQGPAYRPRDRQRRGRAGRRSRRLHGGLLLRVAAAPEPGRGRWSAAEGSCGETHPRPNGPEAARAPRRLDAPLLRHDPLRPCHQVLQGGRPSLSATSTSTSRRASSSSWSARRVRGSPPSCGWSPRRRARAGPHLGGRQGHRQA